ncbi:hypothetical protein TFLX_02352 [Thermoflexales bacterium]|nr:hypothetical protein TFLX_02352 [Thermoflexales bacterium]
MNSTRDYSWFTPLGGLAGLALGLLLAITSFNVLPVWEQQIYQGIPASTDPAVELLGFDYRNQFLYVRSQSQKIYICPVTWFGDTKAGSCHKTQLGTTKELGDSSPCKFSIFPTPYPPGNIIASLEAHPCSDDANIQINWIVLSDNSIWRLTQSTGGVSEAIANFFMLVYATVGIILGLVIGFTISRIARHRSAHETP